MGQAFSEPVTEKESFVEKNDRFYVASSSIQGWRISMEDAHTIMLSMPDDPEASFFAVFDGHGGSKVANYASEKLYQGLCSNQLYKEGRIEEALKNIFLEFDEMMFNDEKMRDELAGSTAVVIVIKNRQIYCANIGDSRAVASFPNHVDPLSIDHKPTCEEEMNRIISAGGWVQFNRVNGNLALSRAFGDFVFKRNDKRSATEQIVIAYPDVQTRELTSDLEFIIMACDGVWDVMTNEEVVEFVRRRVFYRREPVAICEELITRCLAPDCQMGCGIGCDNMTVILICYLNGATYEEFCDRISNSNTLLPCDQHIIGPVTHVSDEENDSDSDTSASSSENMPGNKITVAEVKNEKIMDNVPNDQKNKVTKIEENNQPKTDNEDNDNDDKNNKLETTSNPNTKTNSKKISFKDCLSSGDEEKGDGIDENDNNEKQVTNDNIIDNVNKNDDDDDSTSNGAN